MGFDHSHRRIRARRAALRALLWAGVLLFTATVAAAFRPWNGQKPGLEPPSATAPTPVSDSDLETLLDELESQIEADPKLDPMRSPR